MSPRWLLVGLGNPGPRYETTRHNMGFLAIDEVAERARLAFSHKRFKGLVASGAVAGQVCVLLKPQTFMNVSGESAGPARGFYKIPIERVLVLHDDIDLPLGTVRIKVGGGHGGHNGLRSLDRHLGSKGYIRIRMGVGRPADPRMDVVDWVLSPFHDDELPAVEGMITRAADIVEKILTDGVDAALNEFHRGRRGRRPRSGGRDGERTGGGAVGDGAAPGRVGAGTAQDDSPALGGTNGPGPASHVEVSARPPGMLLGKVWRCIFESFCEPLWVRPGGRSRLFIEA